MLIRIICLLTLIVSCGPQVDLKNSKLESISQITEPNSVVYNHTGLLVRKSHSKERDRLQVSGQFYNVSFRSSHSSLEFIAKRPMGSQVPVKINGKVVNNEFLLVALAQQ